MRQQIDQYLRRRKSENHPGNDGLAGRFSSESFNHLNADQLINFRYFKEDLIFISGLFFVLLFQAGAMPCLSTNCNPNQITRAFVRRKCYANEE